MYQPRMSHSGRNERILVLDGGLGTTLEELFQRDIFSPLWSAKPVDEDPEVIIKAHLAFLRAGADIILTSTYQCAFETFAASGYTGEDAVRIMRKSVKLAHEARSRFFEEQKADGRRERYVKIALSLGPFGATLSPAQEFDGFYPPPYGPSGYSDAPGQSNTNAFPNTSEGHRLRADSVERLAESHLGRLRVFADDPETWAMIDLVAFETVPLSREVKAIRRAVGKLQKGLDGRGMEMKKWWVSTVWPDGRYPEEREPGGERVSPGEVVHALLNEYNAETVAQEIPRPWGVGINCTSLDHLAPLLAEFTAGIRHLYSDHDGGDTYDVVRRVWVPTSNGKGDGWAARLWELANMTAQEERVWDGVVLGGCCRTGPAEIDALVRRVLDSA
ncbi:Homocysteine S-methyltransferase [Rhodofomes roseus]|uniref:Homocysteine S-methyltransferase n=1 Tax=Rhodofomes roseus TaxID=34475 RepID=A0ABQ8JZB8_9APHY|nr:Homocysteine S-methyltransferase [Rhodofomes roseus]KAH9829094.1 Homocysteine S-methyltransferase [Rhodofomes roseus]